MEFKITKEQIDKLARINAVIKEQLNEYFPEAFMPEITEGKWYVNENGSIQFNEKGGVGYGISSIHGWTDGARWIIGDWNGNFVEATREEIEAALIAEAKKRGYKKGVKCVFGSIKEKRQLGTDCFFLGNNTLCVKEKDSDNSDIIFKDGKWAEILPEEKTVITLDKAKKILAKKLKVSPENIEIE